MAEEDCGRVKEAMVLAKASPAVMVPVLSVRAQDHFSVVGTEMLCHRRRMCGLVVASHGRFLCFGLWLCVRAPGGGAADY